MEPDTYRITNTARPMTALRAWMSLTNLSAIWVATQSEVSLGTIYSAIEGKDENGKGALTKTTARHIAAATKIGVDVLMAAELKTDWSLTLGLDKSWVIT